MRTLCVCPNHRQIKVLQTQKSLNAPFCKLAFHRAVALPCDFCFPKTQTFCIFWCTAIVSLIRTVMGRISLTGQMHWRCQWLVCIAIPVHLKNHDCSTSCEVSKSHRFAIHCWNVSESGASCVVNLTAALCLCWRLLHDGTSTTKKGCPTAQGCQCC